MIPRKHAVNSAIGRKVPGKVIAATMLVVALGGVWMARGDLGLAPKEAAADRNATMTHGVSGDNTALDADVSVSPQQAQAAGPISELDKELLVKVRLANLWELPAGRLAQQNASSDQVRRAGLHLIEGHSRLDQIVRELSKALNVPIPDEATAEQQGFVKKMQESKGAEFDKFFANQLRDAHGKVFVVVAQVRSTTQNSLIRDLAIEANTAVSDHLEVLEDTGLVEAATLQGVEAAVVPKK